MNKIEHIFKSSQLKRVLEIRDKGSEEANINDIPIVFDLITKFLNINPEAQKLIKSLDMTIVIDLKEKRVFNLKINKGKSIYGKGELPSPNFYFGTNFETITKILLGKLDATELFFSGTIDAKGDIYYMILFLELLDIALEKLKIIKPGEKQLLIPPSEMKKLLEVYKGTLKTEEPSIITNFYKVLACFINNNPDAQEEIAGQKLKAQMTIVGLGSYGIEITDNKMSWFEGLLEGAVLKLEMSLDVAQELIRSADAVSAYMAGDIKVEGNLQEGIFFQDLIALFTDYINLE